MKHTVLVTWGHVVFYLDALPQQASHALLFILTLRLIVGWLGLVLYHLHTQILSTESNLDCFTDLSMELVT